MAFASCQHGWLFTLQSMAQVYFDHKGDDKHGLGENLSIEEFALRLWGDCYFDDETSCFRLQTAANYKRVRLIVVTNVQNAVCMLTPFMEPL